MSRSRAKARGRKRVGRVSFYEHHGAWWIYHRDGARQVRKRVAETEDAAEQVAAQVNSQLSTGSPTLFAFEPVTVKELRQRYLDHHEHVLGSTFATVRRYQAATQHLIDFVAAAGGQQNAHQLQADEFVRYLRTTDISPNGHRNTAKRKLRHKGIRFILEVCRSLYAFAAKRRHLPPYAENPFSELGLERMKIEDAKPVFVFDEPTELAFFQTADDWSFLVHFTLAKTGMRPGELVHAVIEDLDIQQGWLRITNNPELGWRVKTGHGRLIPLVNELVAVFQRTIGSRSAGPIFLRQGVSRRRDFQSMSRREMELLCAQRLLEQQELLGRQLSRREHAHVCRSVWRDAGAVRVDDIRNSFIQTMKAISRVELTCPKSWRHTFATLLQDANVDPLIRQITLGHKVSSDARGALGMTGIYTHTRPETQKREIERALGLWSVSLQFARTFCMEANRELA